MLTRVLFRVEDVFCQSGAGEEVGPLPAEQAHQALCGDDNDDHGNRAQ